VTQKHPRLVEAVFLGACSLATQTVFLRFILSSQVGGELYAALALGVWIGWVGFGSFMANRFPRAGRKSLWLALAVCKIPLAFVLFVNPRFFHGVIDPLTFLPIVIVGMLLPGLMYGMIFALLIGSESRTSQVYKFEAVGCVAGGLLAAIWIIIGGSDFGILLFISFLEFSRFISSRLARTIIALGGVAAGLLTGPWLDLAASDLRWKGFKAEMVSVGFSGRWTALTREGQTTIVHNGHQIGSIPDRIASEEALLWPFIFKPETEDVLLAGYEGIRTNDMLPMNVNHLNLYNDDAYLDLMETASVGFEIADPLNYKSSGKYDLVSLMLQGPGSLFDYRMETDLFFDRCRSLLRDNGILFVSAPSDENYISAPLADYLTALNNTLKSKFEYIRIIPGPRVGFVCLRGDSSLEPLDDPRATLRKLKIESSYFNAPLIMNRLSSYRISGFLNSLENHSQINQVENPKSVIRYLRWQASVFGRSGLFFDIYRYPYLLSVFPLLALIPLLIGRVKSVDYRPVYGVAFFGFIGMSFEVVVLYLFSTLYGSLYLHIGLLLGVFMAGLAAGAGAASKIRPAFLIVLIYSGAAALILSPLIIGTFLGLKVAGVLLYMISSAAGFATGGGFAHFANRVREDCGAGATLYGADLYGALLAAFFVPGILISSGVSYVVMLVGLSGVVIIATLFIGQSKIRKIETE
jgi:hypothetical protein